MELVLNTFGTSLGCDNGAFVVRNSNGSKRIPTDNSARPCCGASYV